MKAPNLSEAWRIHYQQGLALEQSGQHDLAVLHYAMALEENTPLDAAIAMARTLLASQQADEAQEQLNVFRQKHPGSALLYYLSGLTEENLGALEQAVAFYTQAIKLSPQYAEAYLQVARLFVQLQQMGHAVQAYQHFLGLQPRQSEIMIELADLLTSLGERQEAASLYQQAYRLSPERTDALLKWLQHQAVKEPAQMVQLLIDLAQKYPHLQTTLAIHAASILRVAGEVEEARKSLELALSDPFLADRQAYYWLKELLFYPLVLNQQEIIAYQQRVQIFLQTALQQLPSEPLIASDYSNMEPYLRIWPIFAFHPYLNIEPRPWREAFAKLYQAALPPRPALPAVSSEQVHIVFVINGNSPVTAFLYGVLLHWPEQQSRITICYAPQATPRYDLFQTLSQGRPDFQHLLLSEDPATVLEQLESLQAKLIFFSEVHTDRYQQSFLAAHRLAPVQVTSWLSSGTTGLSTIDYFLSSNLLEQQQAQRFYSEKLILLEHIPAYMTPPLSLQGKPQRSEYGLPESPHIYLCPQLLYKLHPDFDLCLADILEQDPEGILVLLSRPDLPSVRNRLLQRFESSFPHLMPRIWFMPPMDTQDFLGLLQLADVMLDPFYFGGGTTSMEALALGVPVVTWPGERLHGRITYAYYRQMDYLELVAYHPDDYAKRALRLGTEKAWNQQVRSQILARQHVIFDNQQAVQEMANCLLGLAQNQQC